MSVIGDVCKKAFARAHEINGHFEAIMDWKRNHGHEVNERHCDVFQR